MLRVREGHTQKMKHMSDGTVCRMHTRRYLTLTNAMSTMSFCPAQIGGPARRSHVRRRRSRRATPAPRAGNEIRNHKVDASRNLYQGGGRHRTSAGVKGVSRHQVRVQEKPRRSPRIHHWGLDNLSPGILQVAHDRRRHGSVVSGRRGSAANGRNGSVVNGRYGSVVSGRNRSVVSGRNGNVVNERNRSAVKRRSELKLRG